MQAKNHIKSYPRLERLKIVRQWTWKQVAEALNLSVAMLMSVKSGRVELSKSAFWRLQQAEADAGIITRPSPDQAGPQEEPEVLEAHDHQSTVEYLSTTAAQEALEKLSSRNRSLCKLLIDHIIAAERMDAQKRKKKMK